MTETQSKMSKPKFNLRSLRLSLKYRPGVLKLILKLRQCIRKKNSLLNKLRHRLKETERNIEQDSSNVHNNKISCSNIDESANANEISLLETKETNQTEILNTSINEGDIDIKKPKTVNTASQTDDAIDSINQSPLKAEENKPEDLGWKVNEEKETKSIAEQVAEVAQDAIKQSGMVYVESAGMYYDYKTGYYYNSELGLYYHTDTKCYYYYSEDKQSFVFHSYPDSNALSAQAALVAHERRKARKHKMERKVDDDIVDLTKNLSQDGEEDTIDKKKPKIKKTKKKADKKIATTKETNEENDDTSEPREEVNTGASEIKENEKENGDVVEKTEKPEELEDGECSDTSSEESASDDEDVKSNASTATASDDETIAKHHPPCMRVIVRETTLPKLRAGTLFIVTKDGGTVGREGEQHTILLRDHNVSRNHLDIRYDVAQRSYVAMDLGSKNGSILNGSRMSDSQMISEPMQIVHGSILQLGETKLLCHIHAGNDTCGHCEPGLIMEELEKEKKVAYTRTCSIQKQHELELNRLKNKYGAKKMLAIEETAYNDRAQERRATVGSSHDAEKTQTSDIATSIAPDNKGFKLMEKMGWHEGEGLGKDNQGDTEPVPLISNAGKTGLGAPPTVHNPANKLGPATLRLATRTKMLKPPAKAFQIILDEDSE